MTATGPEPVKYALRMVQTDMDTEAAATAGALSTLAVAWAEEVHRHAEVTGELAERRAALMLLRRRQGASFGQIGREVGLTKQGVAWVLRQYQS